MVRFILGNTDARTSQGEQGGGRRLPLTGNDATVGKRGRWAGQKVLP